MDTSQPARDDRPADGSDTTVVRSPGVGLFWYLFIPRFVKVILRYRKDIESSSKFRSIIVVRLCELIERGDSLLSEGDELSLARSDFIYVEPPYTGAALVFV
jgi:hypothetical protein